jgi:uncharacterized protein
MVANITTTFRFGCAPRDCLRPGGRLSAGPVVVRQVVAIKDRLPSCRAMRQRMFCWETVRAATCGLRGSPFQLPTRLAGGLGPGSDLGHGYPRPCAPSPNCFGEFGSPVLTSRKEGQLRLLHNYKRLIRSFQKKCQLRLELGKYKSLMHRLILRLCQVVCGESGKHKSLLCAGRTGLILYARKNLGERTNEMKQETINPTAISLTDKSASSTERKPIDMHVHIVGNGAGGSGCRLHLSGWHKPLASMMLKGIGLPKEALTGDLEGVYVAKLLEWTRESSLGAIVILAQDEVRDEKGEIMYGVGSFYVPNDYVLKLAREHSEFLPAVSIHPARPDAMEELERCLAEGAVMMKCLPNCQNINCTDKKYTKFWERMAEAKLPLLAHTGGEHTVPVVNKAYSNPRILELPLKCGVTVIAAHCATKSGLADPEYFYDFAKMTEEFPNLFGDTSAFNVPLRGRHIDKCVLRPLVERMVHGSDVPVPVNGTWAWMRGYLDWASLQKWNEHPNVLERDYQLKLAMGFPNECFTRIHDILRPVGKSVAKAG